MPRSRQAFPALLGMDHNPLRTLWFDPTQTLLNAKNALTLPNLEALLENAITQLLQDIDNVTGLDLLGFAEALKALFGGSDDILLALIDSIPLLGPIFSVLTGTNPISSLEGAAQNFAQFILDIVSVLGGPSGLGTGDPIVGLVVSDIPILAPMVAEIESQIIIPVIGEIENALPWVLPLTLNVETTFADFGNYLNTLAPQSHLQLLQDTIYNGLMGNNGPNWVSNVSQGVFITALQGVQTAAQSANSIAQQAWNYVLNFISAESQFLIPNATITGSLGLATVGAPGIGGQIQSIIDSQVQGLTQDAESVGNSAAQLANYVSGLSALVGYNPGAAGATQGSMAAITQTLAAFQAAQAATKPTYLALDQTADSTFDFSTLLGLSSWPTTTVTQTQSLIGFIGTPHGGVKESIQWVGGGITNITAFYINLYAYNPLNLTISQIWQSSNIVGLLEAAQIWNVIDIPAAAYVNAQQGNVYAVELCLVGSGSHTVVALTSATQPQHPLANPPFIGGNRTTSPPIFESAVQQGASNATGTPGTYPWTQTLLGLPGEACLVVVEMEGASLSCTATLNGVSMTALGFITNAAGSAGGEAFLFGMLSPPSGPQTIAVTTGGTSPLFVASSYVYYNCSGFGTFASSAGSTVVGGGATETFAVTAAANELVFAAFATFDTYASGQATSPGLFGNFNVSTGQANVRGLPGLTFGAGMFSVLVGDGPGAATTTFTTVLPSAAPGIALPVTDNWVALGVPLIGMVNPNLLSPSYNFSQTITPYYALGGSPGTSLYTPDLVAFTSSGSYQIPQWATHLDVIVFGAGGGGGGGSYTNYGNGGGCGGSVALTLSASQWAGYNTLNVAVGGPGPGGTGLYNGGAGGGSSVKLPNGTILAAAGGGGGGGAGGGGLYGQGEPSITYNNQFYGGGGGGPGWTDAGGQPGGGGGGGNTYPADFSYGGNGGAGAVFILAYTTTP
jgi:hypothetical protein